MTEWLIGGGLSVVLGLLTWLTAARGTAAAAWRDMSKDLREDMRELRAEQETTAGRVDVLEAENSDLKNENRRFRYVVGDMLRYLSEMAAWEKAGAKPPSPYTHVVLLARLTQLTEGLIKHD